MLLASCAASCCNWPQAATHSKRYTKPGTAPSATSCASFIAALSVASPDGGQAVRVEEMRQHGTQWTDWKPFPDPTKGDFIVAPFGPGCYELRDTASGKLVLFGSAGHVASCHRCIVRGAALTVAKLSAIEDDRPRQHEDARITSAASTASGKLVSCSDRLAHVAYRMSIPASIRRRTRNGTDTAR